MPELKSLPPSAAADPSPIVEVEHLSRVYQSRAQKVLVLDDLSFTIRAGNLFAITGPSGSGKSTLLNMLGGIDRPTSGRVLFGGVELRARSENQLARWRGRQVGIVFQFFQLIPTLTAAENVLLAVPSLVCGRDVRAHDFAHMGKGQRRRRNARQFSVAYHEKQA